MPCSLLLTPQRCTSFWGAVAGRRLETCQQEGAAEAAGVAADQGEHLHAQGAKAAG